MAGTRFSRRRFLGATVIATSGAILAACGAAPTPTAAPPAGAKPAATSAPAQAKPAATTAPAPKGSPSGTFRFAIDNDTETRKPAVELFFQKTYPNMKVQFEVTPKGYEEKLLSQIAAKNPPDVAYVHESRFADFASQGAFLPLDDYMARQPLIGGNEQYPLEVMKRNNWWKGKWYALPVGFGALFVRYNKTMFEKAGVKLPHEEWTWDEFREAAFALAKDTNGDGVPEQWGWVGWNPGWLPSWWPLMQSYGSFHFNENLDQCIINNDAGVQVLDFKRSTWCGKPPASPTPAAKSQLQSGTVRLFEGGLAAMDSLLSPQVISSLKNIGDRFEMAIEFYPAGPKGKFVRTGGTSMAIPVGSKYPDIAWELLRDMVGDEEANKLAATYLDGNPLIRLDYILKYNVPSGKVGEKMKHIITDGFKKHGTVVQYAPIGEYPQIVSTNMDKLAACEVTAKAAADAIANQTNKLLKEKRG